MREAPAEVPAEAPLRLILRPEPDALPAPEVPRADEAPLWAAEEVLSLRC